MTVIYRLFCIVIVGGLLSACASATPEPIIITATFEIPENTPAPSIATSPPLGATSVATGSGNAPQTTGTYIVQSGDTLFGIASSQNVDVQALIALNNITNPDMLFVGQSLQIPRATELLPQTTPRFSDFAVLRDADAVSFGVAEFVSGMTGYIRGHTEPVSTSDALGRGVETNRGASQIVERVSVEFGVDARILLAVLEYEANWLTQAQISADKLIFPINTDNLSRRGLYRQLSWVADRLNRGYYGWRYGEITALDFSSGESFIIPSELNSGTVAVYYLLSQNRSYSDWQQSIQDFDATYTRLFGLTDMQNLTAPLPNQAQPSLALPFRNGEVWFFTGGPHGGWGSGSAWSAIDLAPPDDRNPGDAACYVSEYPVLAVADGLIVRSTEGMVQLDLDSDGNDGTGWVILYLHIAEAGRVGVGQRVSQGDVIGYASCEGGFSNATHLHIGRKLNGEWVPTNCYNCETSANFPVFDLGGWQVVGLRNQEYQGYLTRAGERLQAEQGRQTPINRVRW